MNVVREITRINQAELDIAISNPSASWHAQYADSAYIFIGGLPYDLTEGDVIAIFSQYGEVVDVNLPRPRQDGPSNDQQSKPKTVGGKAKHRGFGFLMYEDQRSTVLAVDNLNGAQVLGRTLRVDHVASYKQPKERGEDGEWREVEEKAYNAAPQFESEGAAKQIEEEEDREDLEDPMAGYFARLRREEKGKSKHNGNEEDDKEERRKRKEERARVRAEREKRRARSHREDDDGRDRKRRPHSDDEDEEKDGANRYQQLKKSRSVLDDDPPLRSDRHTSSRRHSRSPSPPQHRDRTNRDRHRSTDKDRSYRDDDRRHGSSYNSHSSHSSRRPR